MLNTLRINAITRAERNAITRQVSETITSRGGWIVDVHLYSNISVCLNFEIGHSHAVALLAALQSLDITLSDDTLQSFQKLPAAGAGDIRGTFQITFVHDEPDMKREVPAVPG